MNFCNPDIDFRYRPSGCLEAEAMLEFANEEAKCDTHNKAVFDLMDKSHLSKTKIKTFIASSAANFKSIKSSIKSLKDRKLKFYSYGVQRPHLIERYK